LPPAQAIGNVARMSLCRLDRVAGAFVGMVTVGALGLWGCESSTDSGSGPIAPSPTYTAPAPTTPPGPTGDASSTPDGGDGGTVDPIPNARTLKLVNLSAVVINGCIRTDGSADPFAGPLFRSGGIPTEAVSARVILKNLPGNAEMKIIADGAGCESAALGTVVLKLATQAEDVHLGVYYLAPGGGQNVGAFVEHLTPTPGKESVLSQPPFTSATFTRDDGVGAPINRRGPAQLPVVVDPGLVGKITLGVPGVERPMKTVAGGTISLWSTATAIILCDERAPAVDGLTSCPSTLRAP
jgi:hypothetical protein